MILRESIRQIGGFRFLMEQLELSSPLGRRVLHETRWLTSVEAIEAEYDRMEALYEIRETPSGETLCGRLTGKLMQVKDIRTTVKHTEETCVLDDLELFELKNFALLADEIRQIAGGWHFLRIPDLSEVIGLLDPENSRVPQFYIYDAYSEELAAIRNTIRKSKQQAQQAAADEAYARSLEIEDRIREELSEKLRPFHQALEQALEQVARLDILLAKVGQARTMKLTRPQTTEGAEMDFEGLFNPEIAASLQEAGKDFQPVDIRLGFGTTVVTGANMAGKTVLLKSLALAQSLMQFGFFVPAAAARMSPVDEIRLSVGDGQDELHGLSSFAAEMLCIDQIIARVKAGRRVLVLIDEPARSTNPVEGKAIVNGVVDLLTSTGTTAVVTTHYSGIEAPCRKLRVKGFVENRLQEQVSLKNIDGFIDYSLLEDDQAEVPHEAVRIARILGVDKQLLDLTEGYLCDEDRNCK